MKKIFFTLHIVCGILYVVFFPVVLFAWAVYNPGKNIGVLFQYEKK